MSIKRDTVEARKAMPIATGVRQGGRYLSEEAHQRWQENVSAWRARNHDRVLAYGRAYRAAHPARQRAAELRANVRRLQRGKPIMSLVDHHKAMAQWKADLGDPRPLGMTLSLAVHSSPYVYVGYRTVRGERRPHTLSLHPGDYVWESSAANNARKEQGDATTH